MDLLQQLIDSLGQSALFIVPLLAIIVGLFVAWIVARLGAFIVRRILERVRLDERVSQSLGTSTQITKWVSGFTFWALFIFVIVQLINLGQTLIPGFETGGVQSPLQALLADWLGRIISVGISLLIAWIIATVLQFLVIRVLNMTRLDERLGEQVDETPPSNINESIGKAVFWLVFLVFIPSILGRLGIGEAAASIQGLVNQMINYIPGIVGAIIILVIGGLLARIVRQIVTGFLQGLGVDRFGERVGLSAAQSAMPLSALLGTVVYLLVLIPVVVQALDVLNLPVISSIGTRLLTGVTGAIINILGAAVILGVAYYLARFIADVVSSLLAGLGINRLPAVLGFNTAQDANLAGMIGYVVLVAVMLFAVQATADAFGLVSIATIVGTLIVLGGRVLLGIVIFLVGVYLANLASRLIMTAGGTDATLLSNVARWAILILVAGIALNQAGVSLAANVVQIILVALGVAFALAFGLGGREEASRQIEKWFGRRDNDQIMTK